MKTVFHIIIPICLVPVVQFEIPETPVSPCQRAQHSVQATLPSWRIAVGIAGGAEDFLGCFGIEICMLQSILQNAFRVQISRFA